MKKLIFVTSSLFFISLHLFAQDEPEVLIGNNIRNISGFGGFTMELSGINHDVAISTGGSGAVLLNQVFFFGGYGMRNHSEVDYLNNLDQSRAANLDFHHGGLWTGYIFKPNKLVHLNVSSKFGWGYIHVNDKINPEDVVVRDNVFTVTPQVEGEINIAYWMRINAALGYRYVNGINNPYFNGNDFSSPTFSVSFLFGWFKNYDFPIDINF